MNRTLLTTLDKVATNAVQEYLTKNNLLYTVKMIAGSFSHDSGKFGLEIAKIGEDGVALTKDAESLKFYAPYVGLPADALGKTFTSRGETYMLIGYRPKSPKFPFIAVKVSTGQEFKFTDSILRYFKTPATS